MNTFPAKIILFVSAAAFLFSCKNNTGKPAETDPVFYNDPGLKGMTEQIKKEPKNAALYYQRGARLHRMLIDSLAIKDFKMAASLDTNKAEYYSAVGDVLFEHKDITSAVQWLQKAIAKNPADEKAHLKIAKLFLYLREYAKGFAEINIVLRNNAYNPEAYFLKGLLYKDMKDTAKAISSFQTAETVAPDFREAVIQLGLLFSAKKDPIALQYLDKAYKMDSTDVFPLFAKGVYYQDRKEYEAAKAEYRKCIIRNSHYADPYFNLGFIYMDQDSIQKAYKQYDIATKIDPANPTAYFNRGICSEMMDSIGKAVTDYKQALALDSSYKSPKDALKRLGVK